MLSNYLLWTKTEPFLAETGQAKSLIFVVVSQVEQVPKVKKTKRNVVRT